MEALLVSTSLLGIVALGRSLAKLVSDFRESDNARIDQIYYRLLSEKKRTEGWANHMRVLNSQDLRATIPPDEFDEVVVLMGKLQLYYTRAEKAFAEIEGAKSESLSKSFLRSKIKFMNGAYDELGEFVNTLAAMNKALKTIAPPLPMYSPGGYARRNVNPDRSLDSVDARDVLVGEGNPLIANATNEDLPPVSESTTELQGPVMMPIQPVYNLALSTLSTISIRRSQKALSRAYSRLKLWGAGLFDLSISLDEILASDEDNFGDLRECILSTLVVILVREEHELNLFGSDTNNQNRQRDSQRAVEITTLLGSEDLIYKALEEWNDALDEEDDTGQVEYSDDEWTVPAVIESLFDLLPAIRAAQRIFCLRKARESKQLHALAAEGAKNAVVDESKSAVAKTQTPLLVERNLDAMANILQARDTQSERQGGSGRLYSPVFRKERERLIEFYSNKKGSISKIQDEEKLKSKQHLLIETLSDFVDKNKERPSDSEKKLIFSALEKAHKTDIKTAPQQPEAERVDGIIDFLRDTTTDMWNIAGAR